MPNAVAYLDESTASSGSAPTGNVRALVFIYLGKVRNGESADEQANERGGYGSGGSCLHRSVRIQRNPYAHTRIPGGHPYALNGDSYGERP